MSKVRHIHTKNMSCSNSQNMTKNNSFCLLSHYSCYDLDAGFTPTKTQMLNILSVLPYMSGAKKLEINPPMLRGWELQK